MSEPESAGPATRFAGFESLPVRITVRVGPARCKVGHIAALEPGSVIPLDRRVGELFELCAGGVVLGHVQPIADREGVALKLVSVPEGDDV